jgi:hypothetical protein
LFCIVKRFASRPRCMSLRFGTNFMNNKRLFFALIIINFILFILLMASIIILLNNLEINKKILYIIILYLGVAFFTAFVFLVDFLMKSKFNKLDLIKFDKEKIKKSKRILKFPIIIKINKSLNIISYAYLLLILIIIIGLIINETLNNKITELHIIIFLILLLIPGLLLQFIQIRKVIFDRNKILIEKKFKTIKIDIKEIKNFKFVSSPLSNNKNILIIYNNKKILIENIIQNKINIYDLMKTLMKVYKIK